MSIQIYYHNDIFICILRTSIHDFWGFRPDIQVMPGMRSDPAGQAGQAGIKHKHKQMTFTQQKWKMRTLWAGCYWT
jgi:hypothetical protein